MAPSRRGGARRAGAIPGVELGMETLASMADEATAQGALSTLVAGYRATGSRPASRRWSGRSRPGVGRPDELLRRASVAADRIEAGIALLNDRRSSRRSVSRTARWPPLAGVARPSFAA